MGFVYAWRNESFWTQRDGLPFKQTRLFGPFVCESFCQWQKSIAMTKGQYQEKVLRTKLHHSFDNTTPLSIEVVK